jgi:class 3 adenylate cyclase
VALVLPFRCYAYRKATRQLGNADSPGGPLYLLPWREFMADLLAWLVVGMLMAAIYLVYFKAPLPTGARVVFACMCFGLFGGMLSFLSTEKRTIARLETIKRKATQPPQRIFSVSRKIVLLFVITLLTMALTVLMMIFADIRYLLTNKDAFGPEMYSGVFKEILFTFVALVVLGLIIIGRYSQNLKRIIAVQVQAMDDIAKGEYHTRVPIVSNDEFGLIAAKTNDMIAGLQEREFCELNFGKYVTPEVSDKILKGEISLEGELGEATILFCDLRGYTAFVERRDPKDVVRFLNDYFTEMYEVIKRHNGIVLQYIGDEIEAVFGTPVYEPNHSQMAVLAALEMRKRLENLNRKREEAGEEGVRHGIGIHTGTVLAGSVGSPERLVYAMVGDAVNLASRIQVLNKKFGTDILISHVTKELLRGNRFELVSLGRTAIRGKSEEIEIFSVL